MNYKKIIADAWHVTQDRKDLFWWFAFIPALLSSAISIVYLSYQFVAFRSSDLFADRPMKHDYLGQVIEFAKNLFSEQTGLAVLLIVIAGLIGLAYTMLPVFTQGALIQCLARIRANKEVKVLDGVSYGFTRFLQLFEFHLLIKSFSLITIVTYAALVLRSLGVEAFNFFVWILALFGVVSLFLGVLFTYSEFYIVIDQRGVFKSMLSSSGLVIRHWHHTLFMFILMAIISIRIVINLLIALLVPVLVAAPIFLFASITLTGLGVIIGIVAGSIALYFAAYFLGIFEVFATAVWTFTFLELTSQVDEDGDTLREQIQAEN